MFLITTGSIQNEIIFAQTYVQSSRDLKTLKQ